MIVFFGPMIYTAPYVRPLIRSTPLRGQVGRGVGPWKSRLFWALYEIKSFETKGHGTWIEKAVGKPADCPGPGVSLWILLNAGLSNTSIVYLICLRLQLDLFPTYMKDGIVMQKFPFRISRTGAGKNFRDLTTLKGS